MMVDDYEGALEIERAWREGLRPDPRLTVSEWAECYRMLSTKESAEPGRWRNARTPYLREIMDCLSPAPPGARVFLLTGAQGGGTELGIDEHTLFVALDVAVRVHLEELGEFVPKVD